MRNCTRCRFITEVSGGSKLVNFCKKKDEPVEYPTLMGRFCKKFREMSDEKKEKTEKKIHKTS